MTIHQFNTLKWIYQTGYITVDQLKKCHQGNIGSLAKNRWIESQGKRVQVTDHGINTMERYRHRLQRKHAAALTRRVSNLLHLGKILQMKKAAA
jgi:hypothetical protein